MAISLQKGQKISLAKVAADAKVFQCLAACACVGLLFREGLCWFGLWFCLRGFGGWLGGLCGFAFCLYFGKRFVCALHNGFYRNGFGGFFRFHCCMGLGIKFLLGGGF